MTAVIGAHRAPLQPGRTNFPECPAWFNEGLASLYEQSSTKNGRIHGKINWRYKALEQAIKDKKLISFVQLTV